ncbi:unnamed protein product [Urochloa decumbens]|uniref:C2 domain-containing protein n=1 Tax=Urochloa decumbens TaxID=240449 RepID=A0ABC9CW38_9POAL
MAYPYVFRAQAPPVRAEDNNKAAKDAAAPVPQAREQWPAGASRSARPHGAGAGWLGGLGSGERLASAYDLVETMHYLYVRAVKARGLPPRASSHYVEARVGNHRAATRRSASEGKAAASPGEWNQVFAFSRDGVQATAPALEVFVRDDKDGGCVGRVAFDVAEVPVRVPPDSPLAPQWYRLEGAGGEVMLAVWAGTQADEAFPDAWHATADGAAAAVHQVQSTRSKVYVTPKLWYLRMSVLEAQDVAPLGGGFAYSGQHAAEVFAKVQVGGVVLRTRPCRATRGSPMTSVAWDEELVFAVAEPFEDPAVLIIEARGAHPAGKNKDEIIIGRAVLPLALFEKRLDGRCHVQAQWFSLEPFGFGRPPPEAAAAFAGGRVQLRACLEGAYHVMEEPAMYASDARPTARQLWRSPVAVLEVGVLGAQGLTPMKTAGSGRGVTDAYCVAKYGNKWVRTRTVVDSCEPRWNEQYTWEVYDPCTVLTLAVFNNCHLAAGDPAAAAFRDQRIGKVRIRLSTLEMDKVYTNAYPLVTLHDASGLRKNGELRLAVRLTCLSLGAVVRLYGQPFLPTMHYTHPLSAPQLDTLRRQAAGIVAARLGRAEPPLRREVVEYMLDAGSHASWTWSIRRSKANFLRATALLSAAAGAARRLAGVCCWEKPAATFLAHVLLVTLACSPELVPPAAFLYMAAAAVWNYRRRPRRPAHVDTRLSCAEAARADELDEEQDTFPTSRANAVVRVRYDRLRSVAGRIQTVVGDVATQGERVRSLLAWRDPRATAIFTAFCLAAAVVLYVTPARVVVLVVGLYALRHPRFRSRLPSAAGNFFKRLPSRADTML